MAKAGQFGLTGFFINSSPGRLNPKYIVAQRLQPVAVDASQQGSRADADIS
ncbi:hypothetical protein APA22_06270 [Acetobacter pasteurianus IFO 3283-22]|uniref:Uncharacterized protein n=1 Tax=Acetobacter pasteurianus (strain NBRC 105184 / IFO 3283-01) TaxID=634452 RepID=C7JDY3_ACEP3|nr:hypothetical protein APA01_06270 [Acetobacter pasteurianus IFO 3283-01]BAI01828.1 hypothetical protein APA03_06270 [Acetobacter pasteurianus IFO 3283-03]BAI04876.1 hypothetical protein APA07_06270 [Acetobacter pasteurianus IFO 3283-07]BAI07923.1 hypothetical protein APA22_06270 [Acetobacter pasteurianus IFO 3283-22]BAI10971.1 hypothetical protein APA26_06270 [Acetobacter pasteurianus IFO 3283-26]BAI14019.1 hypothetical protein APA32_06270 [Acetobacter pasteurianus IFO 3283-32]BAI17065.1 hy